MFPLPPNTDLFMRLLLARVTNPTIEIAWIGCNTLAAVFLSYKGFGVKMYI